MSGFEKHLRQNKHQLESREVDPKVWLSIENEILKSKQRKSSIYLKLVSVAAAVLLGIVLFGGNPFKGNSTTESDLLAKYGLEEYGFTQKVNTKKQTLSKAMIPSGRKADFQILLQQLNFLDGQYDSYLKEIETNGYQTYTGERLLIYYRSKIELLDKIQKEIEKVNYYENKFPSNDEQVGLQI